MRHRLPDLSAWGRRCFGQRLPLTAGFSCPGPDLSGRRQQTQFARLRQALCDLFVP